MVNGRSMLSVCCLGSVPRRLAALLALLRPVADEIVVAVDDRADSRHLASVAELADRVVLVPYADPVERSLQWLHEQTRGDWVFRVDDDEAPSQALLDLLRAPPADATHCFVPRRWLWQDGWLDQFPWRPDWQLRLAQRDAVSFPGVIHIPVRARGPARYVEAPLYHLDLLENDRAARTAKARRYEQRRPGLRLGGVSMNAALYLPEQSEQELRIAAVPAGDKILVAHLAHAPDPPAAEPPPTLEKATRDEIDARWADRDLPDEAYRASIELGPVEPFAAGEVRALDVRVTNLAGDTLRADLPEIRLAYRGLPSLHRTRLPHDLAPGETALVPVSIEAPAEPGAYPVTIDLVHERHRWFDCGADFVLDVRPRRRAVVLVGQPPGDAAFDEQVDAVLAGVDPGLEPVLVGPSPDWLRDRFGVEAHEQAPPGRYDAVLLIPAGRRRHRLRLGLEARRLRRHARG
jgi:hypothetical protein